MLPANRNFMDTNVQLITFNKGDGLAIDQISTVRANKPLWGQFLFELIEPDFGYNDLFLSVNLDIITVGFQKENVRVGDSVNFAIGPE